MEKFNLSFRNTTIFKIFAILMLVAIISMTNILNSLNHSFRDNYHQTAIRNYFLASLISKNSQIDEYKPIEIEKYYDNEFDWPIYGNIRILMSQLEIGENPSIAAFKNYDYSYLIADKKSCISDIFGLDLLRKFLPSEWISHLLTKVAHPYLLIIVNSAVQNFEQRNIIRRTWGNDTARSNILLTNIDFVLVFS